MTTTAIATTDIPADVWAALRTSQPIDADTALVPAPILARAVAVLGAALAPADPDTVRLEVAKLVAAYPSARPKDPAAYIAVMLEGLAAYPAAALAAGLFRFRSSPANKFLPSLAEAVEAVEAECRPRKDARRRAERMLAEHRRREAEAEYRRRNPPRMARVASAEEVAQFLEGIKVSAPPRPRSGDALGGIGRSMADIAREASEIAAAMRAAERAAE